MHLVVDTRTLSPALITHGLLSPHDMEFLQLQAIIDSKKVCQTVHGVWEKKDMINLYGMFKGALYA